MSEAAGDFAFHPRRIDDRLLCRRLDRVMERFETVPGDRRLKRIIDDARRREKLTRVRHSDEGVAPQSRGAIAVRVSAARLGDAAVIRATFQGSVHPRVERMISRLESEN